MSLTRLIKKLEELHQYESEKGGFEANALKLLSRGKVDLDKQKIEDLVTLSESIKPLRKLLHRHIKDLLLELQAQIKNTKSKTNPKLARSNPPPQDDSLRKTQPPSQDHGLDKTQLPPVDILEDTQAPNMSESKSDSKASEPTIDLSPIDREESRLELNDSASKLKPANAFVPRFEQGIQTPPPLILTQVPIDADAEVQDSSSPSESEELAHEALHDSNGAAPADFEELERELRVLTQPSFEQDAALPDDVIPTVQSPVELPFEFSPLPTLDPSFLGESSSEPNSESSPKQESAIPAAESKSAEQASESFNFPMSAGEAGTAVFGEEELRKYRETAEREQADKEQSQDAQIISQLTASFSVHISTPHQVFTGHADRFDHKELVVICSQPLLKGEELKLKFKLPQSQKMIECKALVRSAETLPNNQNRLLLRFLDLRPVQEDKIKAEMI